MSEAFTNTGQPITDFDPVVMAVQESVVDTQNTDPRKVGPFRRAVVAGVAVLGLSTVVAACGGEDKPDLTDFTTEATTQLNDAQKAEAEKLCPEGFDMEADAANNLDNVGSKESFYPSLGKVEDGKIKLVSKEDAKAAFLGISCDDSRSLAVAIAYLVETAENYQLPNATTIDRVAELEDLYSHNQEAALEAVKKLSSRLSFLEPTDKFVTVKGEATQVTPDRNSSNAIVGAKTQSPKVTGKLTGFNIGYDKVSKDTTEEQKLKLEDLKNLILLDPQGRLVIKNWLGESQAKFKIDKTGPTTVPAQENKQENAKNQKQQNNQNANKANNGGGAGNQNGKSTGGEGTGSCGGCGKGTGGGNGGACGTCGKGGKPTPGTTPGDTTPGTTPGTTPDTTPETTPPTTRPPHTVPPTTPTTKPKGSEVTIPGAPN